MQISGKYEVILVEDSIDDEELALAGFRGAEVPCNVTVARDGKTALELIFGAAVPPAFIVLDYKLPIYNGMEVLTELRKRERTRVVPVIIFSGSNTASAIAEFYRIGANSCVTKPGDGLEYMALVKSIANYWLSVNRSVFSDLDLNSHHMYQVPFGA